MQHNFLFPKVASPSHSQCASLRHDVRHCTCSLALLTFFRTFQACNTLSLPVSQVAKFIQNVANIFIFHLTQNFRPATQGASYNLTKSPTAKSLTSIAGPRPNTALPSVVVKTLKRFYSDGKCPLDGTWCQKNNCQSWHEGGNYARGNRQIIRIYMHISRSSMIDGEPAPVRMLTAPFHGTFFSIGS